MVIFEYFLKTKSDQNIHQNAPNCTILKIFFATCKFPILKKKICPPLPNPGDAPANMYVHLICC